MGLLLLVLQTGLTVAEAAEAHHTAKDPEPSDIAAKPLMLKPTLARSGDNIELVRRDGKRSQSELSLH